MGDLTDKQAYARAAARELATTARCLMVRAERMLQSADGQEEAVQLAANCSEPITAVIKATYDGPEQVFACVR